MQTELGLIEIQDDGAAITALRFVHQGEAQSPQTPLQALAARQIAEYLAGKRKRFELPLAPQGTAFQQAVWQALLAIPYGETLSYGQLAARLGSPKAARAVGSANGRNPIALVIPCHRVIETSGGLGGYAYGLPIKRALLSLEGSLPWGSRRPSPSV
ncbi:MAG: methylated-DNA--[protein]-cysteine S-methyltransferase [Christensenellaceae bacterium]|nr:methylated-DNA--[protein]-cysteine S-methyltransferase [Christensenellaceae bacterium]